MKKVLFMSLAMAVAMTGFAQRANDAAKNVSMTAKKPAAARQIDGSAMQGIQFTTAQTMVNATREGENFQEFNAMNCHLGSLTKHRFPGSWYWLQLLHPRHQGHG